MDNFGKIQDCVVQSKFKFSTYLRLSTSEIFHVMGGLLNSNQYLFSNCTLRLVPGEGAINNVFVRASRYPAKLLLSKSCVGVHDGWVTKSAGSKFVGDWLAGSVFGCFKDL
jgi:hypothetical protein